MHRIQEVPFNSDKLQTNTVQVKVYSIIEKVITKKIPKEEFKWKLVRGSGKGGQKINTQPIQSIRKSRLSWWYMALLRESVR